MNNIILRGVVRNPQYSHTIGNSEFYSAQLLVKNNNGTDSVLNLKFKHSSARVENGDYVELTGNVRSFSRKEKDKNKVDIYVFTYFDAPDRDLDDSIVNHFIIDGNICKKSPELRTTSTGKEVMQFIIANNIITGTKKLNSYLPCICWGKDALLVSQLPVGSRVVLEGELRSRTYTKKEDDELTIHVAHELYVSDLKVAAE